MRQRNESLRLLNRWTRGMSSAIVLAVIALIAQEPPQEEQLRTRQLWDTTLLSRRPANKIVKASPEPATHKPLGAGALVGITLWRLRPSKQTDDAGVRALIHEDDREREWTPERITADTPLTEGQKVKISIEAVEPGFLYVIDRDEYADGSKGEPMLIFPTTRIYKGDNRVMAGTSIEIPSPDDNPPYFTVRRSRPNQMSELLTLVVSPQPLPGLHIGMQALKLTNDQVAAWENQWRSKAYKLEAIGEAGKPYTVAEKEAASRGRTLTKSDPLPQSMYRVETKPGAPAVIQLPLRIQR